MWRARGFRRGGFCDPVGRARIALGPPGRPPLEAAQKPDARYLAGPARFLGHPGPFFLPKRAVSEAEGVDPLASCAILALWPGQIRPKSA